MVAGGGLSAFEVYRLKHQHPLNRLTHVIGIPTIVVSIAFPLFAWFAWGVLAWKEWLILSAVGWAFNFWGMRLRGISPPFFAIPVDLIVGPLYFLRLPLLRLRARIPHRSLSSGEPRQSRLPPKPSERIS